MATASKIIPVAVFRCTYMAAFRSWLLAELKGHYEWNPKTTKIRGNTVISMCADGERWRIVVTHNEVRIITADKKVWLRKGLSYNMVQRRWEVS